MVFLGAERTTDRYSPTTHLSSTCVFPVALMKFVTAATAMHLVESIPATLVSLGSQTRKLLVIGGAPVGSIGHNVYT